MHRFIVSLALATAFVAALNTPTAADEKAEFVVVLTEATTVNADKEEGEQRLHYLKAVESQIAKLGKQMFAAGYDSLMVQRVTSSLDAFMRAKMAGRPGDPKKWTDAVRLQLGLRVVPLPDLSYFGPEATEVWEKGGWGLGWGKEVYNLSRLPYYQEYLSEVVIPQMTAEKGDAQ